MPDVLAGPLLGLGLFDHVFEGALAQAVGPFEIDLDDPVHLLLEMLDW